MQFLLVHEHRMTYQILALKFLHREIEAHLLYIQYCTQRVGGPLLIVSPFLVTLIYGIILPLQPRDLLRRILEACTWIAHYRGRPLQWQGRVEKRYCSSPGRMERGR